MQAPHPPLPEYYAHESDRGGWVNRLFDRTAGDYDRIERVHGPGHGLLVSAHGLWPGGLKPGMRVLDIGVGTGLTAREAARLVGESGQVIGVDPSAGMLDSAQVPPGSICSRQRRANPVGAGQSRIFCPWDMPCATSATVSAAFGNSSGAGPRRPNLPAGDHAAHGAAAAGCSSLHARRGAVHGALFGGASRQPPADALLLGHHRGLRPPQVILRRYARRVSSMSRAMSSWVFSPSIAPASRWLSRRARVPQPRASSGSRSRKPQNSAGASR
jgi:hypothetical protein